MKRRGLSMLILLAGTFTSRLLAQETFGPNSQVLYISAWEFVSNNGTTHLAKGAAEGNGQYLLGTGFFNAPVRLPAGARMDTMRCLLWDDGDATLSSVDLYEEQFNTDTDAAVNSGGSSVVLTGGGGFQEPTATIDRTVTYRPAANESRDYILQASLDTNDLLRGCEITWHRIISAPPVSASFGDVPSGNPFYQAIEAATASGIMDGCSGANFCPRDPVTRQQLARFFARALGLQFH